MTEVGFAFQNHPSLSQRRHFQARLEVLMRACGVSSVNWAIEPDEDWVAPAPEYVICRTCGTDMEV